MTLDDVTEIVNDVIGVCGWYKKYRTYMIVFCSVYNYPCVFQQPVMVLTAVIMEVVNST